MHERALRTILLIQAVEESDTTGELLPLAERTQASRAVVSGASDPAELFAGEALSRAGERLLASRAQRLHERLRTRAPVGDHVLAVAAGAGSAAQAMLVSAFLLGLVLAAVNGAGFIDVLGYAFVGLLAWNLLVYVLLIANWLRPRAWSGTGFANLYTRWMASRAAALLRRSQSFNAPLAAALPLFSSQWSTLSRPLVMQRARCRLHIAAALVALGFLAGICVRAWLLRDAAAWASRFFGAAVVRILLEILYAPAAVIAQVALPPDSAAVESLRWTGASGGAATNPWFALIATTVLIYVFVPRVCAALWAALKLWHIGRRMSVPAALVPYARRVLI